MYLFWLPMILLFFFPLLTSTSPLTLPVSFHHESSPTLSSLAVSSLHRAHHLKSPKKPMISTALASHSYGGYSITLSFGSPPQPLPLLLDTGSPLPWVPCTPSYLCRNCNNRSNNSTTNLFLPKSSLTSRLIGCSNPRCSLIHSKPHRCTNSTSLCPPYFVLYGSGSTFGYLLSETLTLMHGRLHSTVVVGCSLVSISQPSAGIAGFSRGPSSLPSQLALSRFSYCLVSRRYDDSSKIAGTVTLNASREDSADGLSFVPFLKNPDVNDVFPDYYYIALSRISVGSKKVRIPSDILTPDFDGDGNGGVIIDSGTTFSFLEKAAFEALVAAFEEQVRYRRDRVAEERTGLRLCYELPQGKVSLPEMALHFKGGAEMRLPLENYFAVVEELTATVCLTVVSDEGGGGGPSGPAMILGSFQQQNYYVVYDLEREKLGFRKEKSCVQT